MQREYWKILKSNKSRKQSINSHTIFSSLSWCHLLHFNDGCGTGRGASATAHTFRADICVKSFINRNSAHWTDLHAGTAGNTFFDLYICFSFCHDISSCCLICNQYTPWRFLLPWWSHIKKRINPKQMPLKKTYQISSKNKNAEIFCI